MYNMEDIEDPKPVIRKVQQIQHGKTFVVGIPIQFIRQSNLSHGDYVKCRIINNQLVIEKAEI